MRLNVYIGFAQPDEWGNWAGTYARHASRFEAASGGAPCLVVPFNRATSELMERLAPDAVLLSGFARSFEEYPPGSFDAVTEWIQCDEAPPTLALCGSHQLLGFLFNDGVKPNVQLRDEPMRRLEPNEPITNPDYHPEFYMERGFYPLELTEQGQGDPLFAGLGSPPLVYESHYCEIKRLPPGWELLASTKECAVQAMRHPSRSLYGVQFHPEDYSDRFPDGQRLLSNFFGLVG